MELPGRQRRHVVGRVPRRHAVRRLRRRLVLRARRRPAASCAGRAARSRSSASASTSTPRRPSPTAASTRRTPTATSTRSARRRASCAGRAASAPTSTARRRSGRRRSTSARTTGSSSRMDAATGDVKWKYSAPAAVHGAADDRRRGRLLLDAEGPALGLGAIRQERAGPHVRAGRRQRQGDLARATRAATRRSSPTASGSTSPASATSTGSSRGNEASSARRWCSAPSATLVALSVAELGSDPTPWKVGPARAHGVLGPLVRAADGVWDPGLLRAIAVLGGVVVVLALIAVLFVRDRQWRCGIVVAASIAVVCALLVPATLLQIGLRDGTAPWFHTNDSVVPDRDRRRPRPRRHQPVRPRLHRHRAWSGIYDLDGSTPDRAAQIVALGHFPYFPGMALFGAGARLLPVAVRRRAVPRAALHARAAAGGDAAARAVPGAARDRRGAGREPAGGARARGSAPPTRRRCCARAGVRVRAAAPVHRARWRWSARP